METFSDEERTLVRRFAKAIVERRMAMPAALFLESMQPMNFLGAQALHFFNPVLGAVFNFRELERVALLLEKREAIPALVAEIERLDDEREQAKKAAKAQATKEKG